MFFDDDQLSAGARALALMHEGRLQQASDTMRAGVEDRPDWLLARFRVLLSQEPDRKNVQRLMALVEQDLQPQ